MLPEKDRLKMIAGGDDDVYNNEVERNKYYTDAKKQVGLETSALDNWRVLLDQAKASRDSENPYKATKIPEAPVYAGGKQNDILNDFYSYMRNLKELVASEKSKALESAETASGALNEWLANNGISPDGTTAAKKKKEIDDELDETLKALIKSYTESMQSKVKSTKSALAK